MNDSLTQAQATGAELERLIRESFPDPVFLLNVKKVGG